MTTANIENLQFQLVKSTSDFGGALSVPGAADLEAARQKFRKMGQHTIEIQREIEQALKEGLKEGMEKGELRSILRIVLPTVEFAIVVGGLKQS
ncbi:MAG: hypothetical protein FD131_5180, partial [Rhodocyclaceae bacterium]